MSRGRLWLGLSWATLGTVALAVVGCGSETSTPIGDYSSISAMSGMYGEYLSDHNNQAPRDEQAFRNYLENEQDALSKRKLTTDKMFVSPRNGSPLAWVYGKAPPSAAGMTYIGYETTSDDGKRLVLATRGMYVIMDEAKFRSIFPHSP